MDLVKISVIIPVYNVEQYLRECIESVLLQSYRNIEILLINDGSTDESEKICKEYANQFSFIRLISKENGGLSDARNVGILNSTGEYLIFLDSDDYWDSDFLSEVVNEYLIDGNIDYLFFRNKFYYEQKGQFEVPQFHVEREKLFQKSGKECLDYILAENKDFKWFAWNGIVKKELIINNKLFFEKGRKFEDILWTPQVFLNARSIDFYDKPIYIYRIGREGQITSIHSIDSVQDSIYAATTWKQILHELLIEENLKERLILNFSERYYYSIRFTGFLTKQERKIIISLLKKNQDFLKYKFNMLNSVTATMIRIFGFGSTIFMFKSTLIIRKKLLLIGGRVKLNRRLVS